MRVLFDHNFPRQLRRHFPPHEVRLTREVGWEELDNGKLLGMAQQDFDVLLTMDANLYHQQTVARFHIAVIVLRAYNNTYETLYLMMPDVFDLLNNVEPGKIYYIYADEKLKESDRRKGKGPATE